MIHSSTLLIITTLILGFLFIQGTVTASKNLGKSAQKRKKARIWAGATFLGWLLFVCIVGATDILAEFESMPPRFLIFLVLVVLGTVFLAFSKLGDLLSDGLPISYLVGFQTFRILAELSLYAAYTEGRAPIQMTFLGINHDILSGVSAPIMVYILKHRRSNKMLFLWNILCLLLLVKIVVVAVLSAPTPFQFFKDEPANTLVMHMPHILLPGILVPFALLGHILVFRWLWKNRKKKAH